MIVREGALDHPDVRALLADHLAAMHDHSPPGSVHALDLSGLAVPAVTFLSAWDGDALLGVGALKDLGGHRGEVKSMRTASTALRGGVAAAILRHMIDLAQDRGWTGLWLETGTHPAFDAAHALYARFGFKPAAPFGGYVATDFNRFFCLPL